MPERHLTIATYAAGASLAAATLIYVFGPTFFLDDDAANSSRSARKKGVVGLVNPANDCFINSVLQALAGLPELRIYLIREMHRRKLDGPDFYKDVSAALEEQRKKDNGKPLQDWELEGLQQGLVTAGLKDILDSLNERPIYKKTISAQSFIRVVETSFRTRISRTQQDAHEFLQVVAERLDDEYHAAKRVRKHHSPAMTCEDTDVESADHNAGPLEQHLPPFPLEGNLESQVECSHCNFKPKPATSSFVSLTLHVPQNSSSTTLGACLDGVLKVEHIDDFMCDRCRLDHALLLNKKQLSKTTLGEEERAGLELDQTKLETALRDDPEKPPKDVKLPDSALAPKRRIARHMRIATFPPVLAIHLSRSVWDPTSSSSKNMAKVSFPETLPLGGLLDRKTYRLLAVVTHKGGHNSGHYESFRRQSLSPPYSTPNSMGTEGIYSVRSSANPSPQVSAQPSPLLTSIRLSKDLSTESSIVSPADSHQNLESPLSSTPSTHSSILPDRRKPSSVPTSVPIDAIPTPGLPSLPTLPPQPVETKRPDSSSSIPKRTRSVIDSVGLKSSRKRKGDDRWWRISDEKVKECKTGDVLGMQREVYLLFYERVGGVVASE